MLRLGVGGLKKRAQPENTHTKGGESIYGKPFVDEFHSRLRFSRRGLVAMANGGANDNRSQFFFTFDKCDHLNRKNTIFGKVYSTFLCCCCSSSSSACPHLSVRLQVTGDTVFNLAGLEQVEVDKNDRPLFPPRIRSVEILHNPFDDIIPRDNAKLKAAAAEKAAADAKAKAKASKDKTSSKYEKARYRR